MYCIIFTTRLLLDTHIVVLFFVDEQNFEKFPSLNYMSAFLHTSVATLPKCVMLLL